MFRPFIEIYTRGIEDIDYSIRFLPILFVLVQLLSASRNVDTILIKNAGHAKPTINRAIIEAIINLGTSILLLYYIGIHGALLGTIIALLYRSNDMIIYSNKRILKRSPWKEYKLLLFNFLIFGCAVVLNYIFPLQAFGYLDLLYKAFIIAVVVISAYIVLNIAMFGRNLINNQRFSTKKS